jgi:hypothetical protein
MTSTYGADSVQPLQGIPASYRADKTKGVMLYGDGEFAAQPDIASIYPRRMFISVTGNPANVDRCRILDVERGDADASHWPAWRAERVAWCKRHESDGWPIVYCSIDPDPTHGVKAVLDECRHAGQEPPLHWFIANYTPGAFVPTAVQVCETIKRITGEIIPPEHIWGSQFADFGSYDKSVIFQPARWE